ncbi:LuxR C-terminal-related transcriptional regulator [Oribacterium sp. NK2B42]|uniref:LuxR C-terminal-related transcriptional regulator n=1 Tax=Oribacterium sp. NK2B42 TaxID=689781 RepID=UPI0012EBAF46
MLNLEARDFSRVRLHKLIFTEDSGQEIADALFISRRVLQRHVAAIYEKTGTKSRVGLFRIYHKVRLEI